MLVDKGSVLIHCRSKYCDFPGRLFQCPEDFTTRQIYGLRSMILQTTEAIEDLRQSHEQRQVIIGTGEHLVLGITSYMKDVLGREDYADCGGRPVYGFFGFVWKKNTGKNEDYPIRIPKGFPSAGSFALLAQKYVLPKWEMRYWEEGPGAAYEEQVEFDRFSELLPDISGSEPENVNRGTVMDLSVNTEKTILKVYPGYLKEAMLCRTLKTAVYNGIQVSSCTGFPGLNSAGRSSFMNVTCAGREEGRILLKRRKAKKHGCGRKQ